MPRPQLEDGYTRIANKILETVPMLRISGTQARIIIAIWRATYGFKRKEAPLAVTYLAKALGGVAKSQIDRELKSLIERKIIISTFNRRGMTRMIGFNKDFDSWVYDRIPRDISLNEEGDGAMVEAEDKPKRGRKKRMYSKDDRYYQMAEFFHSKIMDHAAKNHVEHLVRNAPLEKWADDFRKIVEIDERDTKELQRIIDWCTQHHFWSSNILSPKKLREKYVTLGIQMAQENTGAVRTQSRAGRNQNLLQQKMKEASDHKPGGDNQALGDIFGSLPDGGTD